MQVDGSPFHGLRRADLTCPGLPSRYAEAQLLPMVNQTPQQSEAYHAGRSFVDGIAAGRPASLVLIGSPGVGKSYLSAAVCNAVAALRMCEWRLDANRRNVEHALGIRFDFAGTPRLPMRPVWVNVPSLLVDIKAEMGRDEHPATDKARALRDYPETVVLDDLGRERISEWTGELVYVIVNDRYERRLPTIATSNLTVEELVAAGYWPAISRLAQDGRLVEIKAPDQRLRRAS